jgi:uncharacterized protein (TIGR02246 family)
VTEDFEAGIRGLYDAILAGWNAKDAQAFAEPFALDGEVIGFDGSQIAGRARIAQQMAQIFADHSTGSYVGVVRSVRRLGETAALLRAVSGVVPARKQDIDPDLNAVQSLLAQLRNGAWEVVLYQNTPAAFHGRPEVAEALTAELRRALARTAG